MGGVDRNPPTVMNLPASGWYGWSGASDSLWSQSLRPILDERELAATPRHVAQLVRDDEQLACRYRKAFGAPPSASDDEAVFVDVGKGLAAFPETLVSGRTPLHRFRDALAKAERPASETYSEVVRHYAGIDPASLHAKDGRPGKPLDLTPREQTDLVVFLESLSTFSNPWRPDDGGVCH